MADDQFAAAHDGQSLVPQAESGIARRITQRKPVPRRRRAVYQNQVHDIGERYLVANLAANRSVNGLPGTLWLTKQKRVDRDYAVFGETSFDFTPNLTLTAAGCAFILRIGQSRRVAL